MKFLLAVYDPAHQAPNGSYWTWHHPELTPDLLNRLYYDVAAIHRPADPASLSVDDLHAGFATLADGWCCWYRFVNGGRDLRGRPGRSVLLCAFAPYDALVGYDGSAVLHTPLVRQLARLASGPPPVSPPTSFVCDVDLTPLAAGPGQVAELQQSRHLIWQDAKGDHTFRRICANLPSEYYWTCRLIRTSDRFWAEVAQSLKLQRSGSLRSRPTQATLSFNSPTIFSSRSARAVTAVLQPRFTKALAVGSFVLTVLVGVAVAGWHIAGNHRSPSDMDQDIALPVQPSTESASDQSESSTDNDSNEEKKRMKVMQYGINNDTELRANATAPTVVLVQRSPWKDFLCFILGIAAGIATSVVAYRKLRTL